MGLFGFGKKQMAEVQKSEDVGVVGVANSAPPSESAPTIQAPLEDGTAWCAKCRKMVPFKGQYSEFLMKKGKKACLKGTCNVCGTRLSSFVKVRG